MRRLESKKLLLKISCGIYLLLVTRRVARFSVLLEDSEVLLLSIGQHAWVTSPRSIAGLEDLLPPSEKPEWAKRVKETTWMERFEKFKTFLRDRKEELEAFETIGTKATAQVEKRDGVPTCTCCHKRGHSEEISSMLRGMIWPR